MADKKKSRKERQRELRMLEKDISGGKSVIDYGKVNEVGVPRQCKGLFSVFICVPLAKRLKYGLPFVSRRRGRLKCGLCLYVPPLPAPSGPKLSPCFKEPHVQSHLCPKVAQRW